MCCGEPPRHRRRQTRSAPWTPQTCNPPRRSLWPQILLVSAMEPWEGNRAYTEFLWWGLGIETVVLLVSRNAVQRFSPMFLILLCLTGLLFDMDLQHVFPVLPALALTAFACIWVADEQIHRLLEQRDLQVIVKSCDVNGQSDESNNTKSPSASTRSF